MSRNTSPRTSIGKEVAEKLQSFALNDLPKYVSTALLIPDDEVAKEHLVIAVQSAFYAVLSPLSSKIDRTRKQSQSAEAELEEVKAERKATSKKTPSWRGNQGKDDAEMIEADFSEWQSRHKVEAILLMLVILIAAAASFITAYTNLIGSGVVVFLDNPLLPASMASLAPLCGFAIKSVNGFLRSGWQTRSYIFSLVSAMMVSVVLWIVLYADSYHGLSPNAFGGGFLDDASWWDGIRDTIFIIVSLSTEILIGAVFALRLTIIAGRYSPDYSHPNQDYVELENRETVLEKRLPKLVAELDALTDEQGKFEAELKGYINTALMMFESRRGQPTPPTL